MAYSKQSFTNQSTVLMAEHLDHIEDGIYENSKAIEEIIAELNYKEIDIIKFTNSAAGTHELGKVIDSLTLSWELNKEPTSQTVNGETVPNSSRDHAVLMASISKSQTYTLEVTDERGATDKASSSINFYNGVYYGSIEYGTEITRDVILGLKKKIQSGKAIDFSVSEKRPVYACPTRYGKPTFKIGGFEYEWTKVESEFMFENSFGYEEQYDVWMHNQNVTSQVTINVT